MDPALLFLAPFFLVDPPPPLPPNPAIFSIEEESPDETSICCFTGENAGALWTAGERKDATDGKRSRIVLLTVTILIALFVLVLYDKLRLFQL